MDLKALKTGELKKHIGAIYVAGDLTLLQRKIANILLFNAYDKLLAQEIHEIRLKDLADVAGYDSNDTKLLKNAFRKLASTGLEWNILDEGEERWGTASFISDAEIIKGRGICQYSYSPKLRKKLFNPEIYARINLSIQRNFLSTYSLVLYETCIRFRSVISTGWIGLSEWRDLFGIKVGQYKVFSDFSKRVLKPAIKEVNESSDIFVEMESRREKRRIVALRFTVRENPQLSLEFPMVSVDNPLLKRLLDFGVSKAAAVNLLTEHETEQIESNLDYVQGELESGHKIKRIAAFTVKAIQDDYRPKKTEFERTQEEAETRRARQAELQRQLKKLEEDYEKEKSRRVHEAFEALPEEDVQTLLTEFEEQYKENNFVMKEYRKKGVSSRLVRSHVLQIFKARQYQERPRLTLAGFARSKGKSLQKLKKELADVSA
jgi:hypothetical protein